MTAVPDGRALLPVFPSYTEVPRLISVPWWRRVQVAALVVGLGEITLLLADPVLGERLFFGLVVPALPALWLVAPGIWRNVCPLATANQAPRLLGFSRARRAPAWVARHGFLVACALLLGLIPARRFGLETHGAVLAGILLLLLAAAFGGGVALEGKSGWCSTLCPLLPVQRLYGQDALVNSPNSHCQPCVGCARNCHDFNPHVAFLADQYDDDRTWMLRRRLFAALFPGFVVGFYTVPTHSSAGAVYLHVAVAAAVSAGLFLLLDALLPLPPGTLTAVSAAAAFTLYYWWTAERAPAMWNVSAPWLTWGARATAVALGATFLVRAVLKERVFQEVREEPVTTSAVARGAVAAAARAGGGSTITVVDAAGVETAVSGSPARSVLDTIESAGIPIGSGCRMGSCGADPVAVLAGAENLNVCGRQERQTLQRLGLGDGVRLACVTKGGPCTVSLQATAMTAGAADPEVAVDQSVRRVVVVGNGIAGVTAADFVRRLHPDCSIDLVAREPHPLYNRMALSRVIYGRDGMQDLYLQPQRWYADRRITTWLNTAAVDLHLDERQVRLGTGETLDYDRLILATGADAFVPPVPGLERRGVFVCRSADDASAIRQHAQHRDVRRAVVAGGGLLGIEAAYALSRLGTRVTVLERSPWLLSRQLDEAGGRLLQNYLANIRIEAVTGFEVLAVEEDLTVRAEDGRSVEADLVVVAAGIRPSVELARSAGLATDVGIVVDAGMRTSDPFVLAAGDCASLAGRVAGLWPPAVRQAEVAARNALGDSVEYVADPPQAVLKVVGVDLVSLGREEREGDVVVAEEDPSEQRYRKLVFGPDDRLAGAILLGHPDAAATVTDWLASRAVLTAEIARLTAGDWRVLRSGRQDSNLRSPAPKAGALATTLRPVKAPRRAR